MGRRGRSTERKLMGMVCLFGVIALVHSKPSSGLEQKSNRVQTTEDEADDTPQWKMDWWDPEGQEDEEGWKVFKTDKKALKRRWWEEDWKDDQWWAPKDDSSSSSSSSRTKYANKKKKGENKPEFYRGQERQMTKDPKEKEEKKAGYFSPSEALPDSGGSKTLQVKAKPKKGGTPGHRNAAMPAAESPMERPEPVWDGEVLISPFEDPKPAPFPSSPRDEAPDRHQWEHHQSGLGRYIDHNHSMEPLKAAGAEHRHNEDRNEVHSEKEDVNEDSKATMEEHGKTNKANPRKILDQFYGFGLESVLSAPANELVESKEAQKTTNPETTHQKPSQANSRTDEPSAKETPVKFTPDNYNKGVIYDFLPSPPEQTHPVKKNLIQSVKKDPSHVEYGKDFVSTKASQQTSPNPPPPGLAQEAVDAETTPLIPRKKARRGKSGPSKPYVKSRPLTFCKLNTDCRKGRRCRRGLCVCLAEGECRGHKPVCGSDGVQYPSHCELHRTACVTRVHIKVDRSTSCFKQEKETTTATTTTTTTTPEVTTTVVHVAKTASSRLLAPDSDDDAADDHEDDQNDDDDDDDDDGDSAHDDEYYDDEYYDDNEEEKERLTDDDYDEEADLPISSTTTTSPPENAQDEDTKGDKLTNGDNKSTANGDNPAGKLSKGDDHETSQAQTSVKGGKAGKGDYDYQADGSFPECSSEELRRFKRQLLSFYCQRFQEPDCKLEVREEREYLSNLLFSYLDMDTDYYVSYRELRARQASPRLPQLSVVCELTDLVWNDDVDDVDGRLSLQEFSEAFSDLFQAEEGDSYHPRQQPSSSYSSSSSPVVNLIPTLATVGNGLELKCGLEASGADVVWKRHGVSIRDLDLSELLVLEDGSLFFSKMGVHHMGNYSCQNVNDPSVLQVHSLKVQMPPLVKVSPHSQIQPSRATVKMRCHAEGVPRPSISWHMNNMDLRQRPHRYSLTGKKEQLTIYEADYQLDTGAYKCMAKNQAGTSQDLSSLFIIGDKDRSVGMGFTNVDSGKFVVFHDHGYTVYDPNDCLKHHTVHGDFGYFKFIPDSLDRPLRLCDSVGGGGGECSWGKVVNVRNSLLYVTQPALNRVVVVETAKNWIPVQVIATDRQPMQVHYVTHLDQVWVLCWNGGEEEEESNKTMVVVRDASKYIQHRVVHTQPVGNRFDQIQALFIAPPNDLRHTYDYGYVTHSGQQTLTKLDLDNMRYVHTIDLSPYDCVPRSVAFVPIGGHVVVECVSAVNHQTLQLVLDYLTDAVVSTGLVSGRPHVSPDSRHVVTVDDLTGKVSVSGVNNEGTLEAAYEVTVSASISDVAFFPALGHGYLLVLTSADDDDIITINLSTGKVDKMKGTNRKATSSDWYPSPVKRAIISGDVFSDFLLAPSKSSLSIMDMKYQQVKCEYPTTPHVKTAVFVRC